MSKDEVLSTVRALKLAQEAGFRVNTTEAFLGELERFADLVASAERERIKQANAPEIERVNAHIKELEDASKKPEQERFLVATIGNWGRVEWTDGVFPSIGDKMYSAPPKWVGLTFDERLELAQNVDWPAGAYCEYAEKIEDKLKDKNT